jgi:hypothetical protein
MTNPKIASWQAVFRTIDESGYRKNISMPPIEPSWFGRFWEYLSAIGIYWWAALAVLLTLERLTERIFPAFWKMWVDPWFTPVRRKQALILFAVVAFLYGNFRAFDDESKAARTALAAFSRVQGERDAAKLQVVDLQREIDRLKSQPPATSSRKMDSLYQLGEEVGTVRGAMTNFGNSSVSFQAVASNGKLDPSREVEYQDYVLRCNGLPQPALFLSATIGGTQCTILRHR